MTRITATPGEHIERAAERAIKHAVSSRRSVLLVFNDTEIVVTPNHASQVCLQYHALRETK